jgi:hypothetical protein
MNYLATESTEATKFLDTIFAWLGVLDEPRFLARLITVFIIDNRMLLAFLYEANHKTRI